MITRDFDTDEIVITIGRGKGAAGFARFLESAADAIEDGRIPPTNDNPSRPLRPKAAADELRKMAEKIKGHNA